jgi:endonuclease YncB( thermonuclease family)
VYRASDGLFVNFEMVRTGMAVPLSFRPNTTYTDDFSGAGTAAERHAIGLWSACAGGHEPLGAPTLASPPPLPATASPK